MSSSGSSSSSRPPPPPPQPPGGSLGVAEEDRIEVEHVRPQPPPPPPPTSTMLPYHHRSRNNDDPDFQTTTLTRPPLGEGATGAFSNFIALAGKSNVFYFRSKLVESDGIRPRH